VNRNRAGSHSVSRLTVHVVWVTKYRYHVLLGDVKIRCRELIMQICDAEDVVILKGVVSKDHVHMHLEYPPSLSVSDLMKRLKGRTSRLLQQEFPALEKRFWGKHFWAVGYGAWSTGNITDRLVDEYLEHHRSASNQSQDKIILED
jgi:putative transposase